MHWLCSGAERRLLRSTDVVPCPACLHTLRRDALPAGCRACTSTRARPPPRQSPWSDTDCSPRRPPCTHQHTLCRACLRSLTGAYRSACWPSTGLVSVCTRGCTPVRVQYHLLPVGRRLGACSGPQHLRAGHTALGPASTLEARPAQLGWLASSLATSLGAQASTSAPGMLHLASKQAPSVGGPHPWRLSCRWGSPMLRPQWGSAS